MKTGMTYFFALSVLCIRSLELPVIVVLTDTSEKASAASDKLKYITNNSDYVWIFGTGTITHSAAHNSNMQYPRNHKSPQCGDPVEAHKDESGTMGLFICKAKSRRIHGITVGHVLKNLQPGKTIN
jgi:hypothetical protein